MNNKQVAALLDKYSNGTCTPEEMAIIHKWYSTYHVDQSVLSTFSDKKRELIKSRMLNEILNEINEKEALPVKPLYTKPWIKIAIAAMLLICLSIGFNKFFAENDNNKYVKIVNNSGNMMKQVLPDKSIVWLNPNSNIKFPKKFEGQSRDFEMEGECFFEITKNPNCPFIIHSKHLVTKVWGTKFKILDKEESPAAEVAVLSGKVSVSVEGSKASTAGAKLIKGEVILHPQQKVSFQSESNTLKINREADVSQLKIYEYTTLLFEDATLQEIVLTLTKKFNTKIIIKDKTLYGKVMNADLTNLNLPEILEVLKASLKINYELLNNQIVLIEQ